MADLRIVAALAWYDEPIDFLQRCVASLEGVADHLVACDGPWVGFPFKYSRSSPEQVRMIAETAASIGIECEIQSGPVWDSQVEKRSNLMQYACTRGDWVLVIDGDEFVHEAKPFELRAALDSFPGDVAMVGCVNMEHGEYRERPSPIRRIYRAASGVTVETAHNGYRTRDGRWLHGDPCYVRLEDALDLSPLLTLRHERAHRGGDRDVRRLEYRRARRDQGLERWAA